MFRAESSLGLTGLPIMSESFLEFLVRLEGPVGALADVRHVSSKVKVSWGVR